MKIPALLLALASALAFAADNAVTAPQSAASHKPQTATYGAEAITIPQMLSYQGRLTDSLGVPVGDTTYSVTFRLYDVPTGGSPFWSEAQLVRTKTGLFSVLLGSATPIDSMPTSGAAYVGMAIEGGSELAPRLRIVSAAYAYLTQRAANSDRLQGKDTAAFAAAGHNHDAAYVNEGQMNSVTTTMIVDGSITGTHINHMGAATGQVLKWAGSAWAPGNDSLGMGGGTVTKVVNATGVVCSPNPITDSGTVRFDTAWGDARFVNEGQANSVTGAMITDGQVSSADIRDTTVNTADLKDNAVTSVKILDGGVTSADIRDTTVNTADLKNAAVTMAKINQAGATTGQVIKWTGSAWAPLNDSLGTTDNAWVRSGSDSVLYTVHPLGLAMSGNVLLGGAKYSHVNFGVACTTGSAACATISGGNGNRVAAYCGAIGGGEVNLVTADYGVVAGGGYNEASGDEAGVLAGMHNRATGVDAVVGGGWENLANEECATVGGGEGNDALGYDNTIAGGGYNHAEDEGSTIGGGFENEATSYAAFVGGGDGNQARSECAVIAGGSRNQIYDSAWEATIGGGDENHVSTEGAFIGGGGYNVVDSLGEFAAIAGGEENHACGYDAAIGGGCDNYASGENSTVAGGTSNEASGGEATICGGYGNIAGTEDATVSGGQENEASDTASTIAGGYVNLAAGWCASVGGGFADSSFGDYSFTVGNASMVPADYENSAAFNGQTATASNQTRVGVLSKASGTFTIDDPLDPQGKILNHYFIEGPEMRNIYEGEVVLDATGRAVVTLPDYFGALNRNPHVQLTGVGTPDVFVAEKVTGDRFTVGGKPGTEVYWQVTGERKDVSAEATRRMMPVEQLKTGALAGRMLDDDFLAGCMDQLVRDGRAQGIDFRTVAGRQRYENAKQARTLGRRDHARTKVTDRRLAAEQRRAETKRLSAERRAARRLERKAGQHDDRRTSRIPILK